MKTVNSGTACRYTADADGVAVMEIHNPPMNALSTPVIGAIRDTVMKALQDDDVRVIVLTGAGKAFIAGAEIREIRDLHKASEGSDYLIAGQELFNMIENAEKPFIAAINGFCLGGGLECALACHIRIADENAMLGLPEIKLGIMPGYAGTQRTTRLIGKGRACELVLSGNIINGSQAELYGLINRKSPPGESLSESKKLAADIAKRSRCAVKTAMTSIREGYDMELAAAQKFERDLFGTLCETSDKEEGIAAFLDKREPLFTDK
jgi:enoyl-CoA hydratase/carnithine racemase